MKKIVLYAVCALLLIGAVSCASLGNSYFAGTVGGIYLTSDDYATQTSEVENDLREFQSALWMYNKNYKFLRPEEVGNKVVFYSDVDNGDAGFDNALVPANYRATEMEDAGFIIIAEESEGIFFNEYAFSSGQKCKVYKGAAVLKLYSIKTGELLYTSDKVAGPEPPKQLSVYGNPSEVTYDYPSNSAFAAKIKSICSKISNGQISKSVPDKEAMEAAGVKVKETKKKKAATGLIGTWSAKTYGETLVYKFTDRGFAVFELYADGVLESVEMQPFSFTDTTLNLDGDENTYEISGKELTIESFSDEVVFKQTSNKVDVSTDKTKLYGVWKEKDCYSSITLGMTKNGFSIFYGTSRGMADWKADSSMITFIEDSYDTANNYWIIDDALYIQDEGYFGEYSILKFTRQTSGGKDSSTSSILTSHEWDYVGNFDDIDLTDPEDIYGDSYTFNSNGTFKDVPFHGTERESAIKGTYTFQNHIIELSDGRSLTFAYIDGVAIGYSF